jgi:hypothetical protein
VSTFQRNEGGSRATDEDALHSNLGPTKHIAFGGQVCNSFTVSDDDKEEAEAKGQLQGVIASSRGTLGLGD